MVSARQQTSRARELFRIFIRYSDDTPCDSSCATIRTHGVNGKGITDVMIERLGKPTNGSSPGIAIAAELIAKIKAIPGVRGIHLLTARIETLTSQLIRAAELA